MRLSAFAHESFQQKGAVVNQFSRRDVLRTASTAGIAVAAASPMLLAADDTEQKPRDGDCHPYRIALEWGELKAIAGEVHTAKSTSTVGKRNANTFTLAGFEVALGENEALSQTRIIGLETSISLPPTPPLDYNGNP